MQRQERIARVQQALATVGDALNISAFARQLGVTDNTVRRDIEHIANGRSLPDAAFSNGRASDEPDELEPQPFDDDIRAERGRVAHSLLDVADVAQLQYEKLTGGTDGDLNGDVKHATSTALLRVKLDALKQYTRLKTLERPLKAEANLLEDGSLNVILTWDDGVPDTGA